MEQELIWGKWYTPKKRISAHIFFWVVVSTLYFLTYERMVGRYFWIFAIKDLLVTSSLFYMASWIMPKWVSSQKIVPAILFIVFSYFWWVTFTFIDCKIASYIIPVREKNIYAYFHFFLEDGYFGLFKFRKAPDLILDFLFLVSLPLAPKLTKVIFDGAHRLTILERDKVQLERNKLSLEKDKLSLERDNLQMELNILKSQISPHFVFNTLNSIYRMAEIQDFNTPDAILNLSNLLRHILYQTKDDMIYISQEVQFLKDFISLMTLRYGDSVKIDFNFDNIREPYQIVPLVLIPFLENAIKHGPDRSRKNAWIKIHFVIDNGVLVYNVSNSVNNSAEKPQVGGIGLQNVRRRLEIYYKERYSLEVIQEEESYSIFLKLKL
ncbi:MAG: ypdA 1 [Sphingobacterium sp.]|jgi:sensor histidine kinase YesM|nr:ypdA 1 [Sphingobacterium sp.]